MCIRYFRHCRDCDNFFTLSQDANSVEVPIIIFNISCGKLECLRINQHIYNPNLGNNSCGSSVCSNNVCKIIPIYLSCGKEQKNDWKYIKINISV